VAASGQPGPAGRRLFISMAVNRYINLDESAQLAHATSDAEKMMRILEPFGYVAALSMGNYWSANQVRTSLSQWARATMTC
jgi:hypothetical protein